MKVEVNTTSITQPANDVLGKKETKLYYLILGEKENKLIINVGEKTHNAVKKLTGGK